MQNLKVDKMRYQNNKSAYSFILLGLVLNVVALFMSITPSTIVSDYLTAIHIIINIVIMLTTFLAAEKCKIYSAKWGIGSIILALFVSLQLFLYPTHIFRLQQITTLHYIEVMILLFGSSALIIVGGLITIRKRKILQKHLKEIGE